MEACQVRVWGFGGFWASGCNIETKPLLPGAGAAFGFATSASPACEHLESKGCWVCVGQHVGFNGYRGDKQYRHCLVILIHAAGASERGTKGDGEVARESESEN